MQGKGKFEPRVERQGGGADARLSKLHTCILSKYTDENDLR